MSDTQWQWLDLDGNTSNPGRPRSVFVDAGMSGSLSWDLDLIAEEIRHDCRLKDAQFIAEKTELRLRHGCYTVPKLLALHNYRETRRTTVKERGLGKLRFKGDNIEERDREREKERKKRCTQLLREHRQRLFDEEDFKPLWERGLSETRWELIAWDMRRELKENEL